jgi:hypothetical protein
MNRARLLAIAAATLLAMSGGCAPRARYTVVYGYAAYYPDEVPKQIGEYPHVEYEGSFAYLVGSRWFYAAPHGWVVFREEPAALRRFRTSEPPPYVHEAPPAPTDRRTRRMRRDVLSAPATPE